MVTDVVWSAARAEAVRKFGGQLPRSEDEQVVIDVFEFMPEVVSRHVDEVAAALEARRITWAWSVLAKRLQGASEPLREATAQTGASRTKRVRMAEGWIVNAGCYCDTADQVIEELFESGGEHGPLLADFADDESLRERMAALWRERRPVAERADREHVERMAAWRKGYLRRFKVGK